MTGELEQATVEAERQVLYETALARVETVDGVDFLDGFKLPPDDDGVWNPRSIRGTTIRTRQVWDEEVGTHIDESYVEVTEFDSRLTNSYVRRCNIGSISRGGTPVFLKWGEVLVDKPEEDPQATPKNIGGTALMTGGTRLDEILPPEKMQELIDDLAEGQFKPVFPVRRRRSRRRLA